ncbi:MAG: hypothetical protein F4047_05900 [Caldilineaceae bacterium SB0670_bin_27]|uniref:Uncharacterized protein n=1 Tax=Caldilineaceae bacterium SB0664_bin_27 TaxID=2605260 RepID=A0A6B0Z1K6_9CHLR|nr:hypothetical protein [Caldilineaceae bacterium SB0664_bin_27]MYJ77682.1 hypothetical protein [Caldilineaceae bacterium SB0670_bin_27]
MSTDTTRSDDNASKAGGPSEDAVVKALGRILSQSEAARSALATTLREGGTAVGTIAGVDSQAIDEEEHPSLAGLDEEGVVRVLVQPLLWAGLSQGQPNAYFKRLPLDRPAALLFVAPPARLARLWPELCRRADEQFTIIGATTPGDLRAATVSGGERRLMLTSWDALLEFMERVVRGAGNREAEVEVGQLRGLIDRMDKDACKS